MRALLLSAYDATSHRRWHRGLVDALGDYDWTVLTLPPRHFKWRKRGNALWWALEEQELAGPWDLVVAASTVDLAALIGLVPRLGEARIVAYFHENQFAYPTRDGGPDAELLIGEVYTAAAADAVVFNSEFNRRSFLDGTAHFGRTLPDFWPPSLAEQLEAKSRIIAVGLDDWAFDPAPERVGPMRILWNHRWEYDKGPDRFFAALALLAARDVDFRVDVVGQRFRSSPGAFETGREVLGDRIDTFGWVDDPARYRAIVRRADVVVSTALHEFQGLAVLEAVASGCVPALPDRLVYPEIFEGWCLYGGDATDPQREARQLAVHLEHLAGRLDELRAAPAIDLDRFRWRELAPHYRAVFEEPLTE